MFEPFPEINIRNHYVGECMDRTQDVVTRDIVMAMLYVVLDRLRTPPGKVIRFCNQMQLIYDYDNNYLSDITQVSEDCGHAGLFSDWYWTPPAVAGYAIIGMEVNWEEATEHFKYDNVKAYSDSCADNEDRYYVMKDIVEEMKKYSSSHAGEIEEDQLRKVSFLLSHAEFEYNKDVKAAEEKKKREEEAAKQAEEELEELPWPESIEYEQKLSEKDTEIEQMKQDIEHKNQYIRDHDQKFSELQQLLNASEEEVKQLKEQLAAVSEEDEQDEPNERTQKVVTNYLFSILKKAGMGNDTSDFNKTDVADLIHYLTGFSTNTIRTTLTYPRTSSSSSKEVKKVEALLKKVNLNISIK